jgi:hypothetical protein
MIFPSLIASGGVVHVHFPGIGRATLRILNMEGAVCAMMPLERSEFGQVRLPPLSSGPYLISIEVQGQPPLWSKVIVE